MSTVNVYKLTSVHLIIEYWGMNSLVAYQNSLVAIDRELLAARYSESTRRTYMGMFKEFLKYIYPKTLHTVRREDILEFQHYLVDTKKVSRSYQNQSINAIKFFSEKVLGMPREYYELRRPKREKRLPTVLSKDEVKRLLAVTANLKHRAILTTIYASGLRMSEVINLEIKDIDSDNRRIWIKNAKGAKDRLTLLSDAHLQLLRSYYRACKPKRWLFEGPNHTQYSPSSVRNVFHRARKKAGILKSATVHTLRHSFATHLLENGVNLRHIQELLGHSTPKTTEIYTHVCSSDLTEVKSPFEGL